ncbi:hypothetical protein KL951_001076 [Ogataea haglerorum]|nr:hypothetical protein KL951_001076 [Ogataea haglerorum]KAG7803698.1 hypothetical protein KL944_001651 [Ogataea haglerorum]
MTADWKEKAAAKRAEVHKGIPQEWILPSSVLDNYDENQSVSVLEIPRRFLSDSELAITENYSASELHNAIVSGKLTSLEVTTAFCHRAAIATQLTNCCTEIMFEYGIERAKMLDNYLETHGKPIGPLHGVPVSLKDSFNIPGYDSTIGYVSFIGNAPKTKSSFAEFLEDNGAVFYVKTNIPQTLMTADSENNIFGRTLNPSDLSRTAGGSSGGEGALIKLRGSILGIGTDIAGSIRIPALCNGVYGYKPSSKVIPFEGQTSPDVPAYIGVDPCAGPLATNLEDITMLTDILSDSDPTTYDPNSMKIDWKRPSTDKLQIGLYLGGQNDTPPADEISSPILKLGQKLAAMGHNVIDLSAVESNLPSLVDGWELAVKLYGINPDSETMQYIFKSGEPCIASLMASLPPKPESPHNDIPDEVPTVRDAIKVKKQQAETRQRWFDIFGAHKLDILLTAGAPYVAPAHDTYGPAPYTAMWNIVDFPALIIPLENPVGHLPAHVQVVAPWLKDAKLLASATVIQKSLSVK